MALDLAAFDAPVDLHIGEGAATARLHTSRGAVEAMLQSLLNNAVDHGEAGVPIAVDLRCERDTLILVIRNRIGLVRRHSGLGVGMYLCRRLGDQIGATLSIDADGRDYQVAIRVPLGHESLVDEHVAETPHVA
jgi:signal transduction histidine kinase